MSSLHQDRPLAEDSAPRKGTRRIPAPAQGKTRTPAAATGEKAPDNVPTPRSGNAQSRTSQTTPARRTARSASATGTPAKSTSGTRSAAAGSSTAAPRTTRATGAAKAATAKAATAKPATAKPATAKPATAKPATAKPAAAAKSPTTAAKATAAQAAAKPTPAKAVAKPAAAKAPATPRTATKSAVVKPAAAKPARKATAAKPVAAKPAAAETAVETTKRPTPYKRPAVAVDLVGSAEAQAREVVVETVLTAVLPEPVEPHDDPFGLVGDVAEGRRGRFLRRRVLTPRRRPVLFLAAALIGALGVSLTTGEPQPAQAGTATVSHSVSVAEELGIELEAQPIEEITPEAATERLGELAASRTERDQDQARAALVQARADRQAAVAAAAAAAEAARPKAVLPVTGARLTSGFGSRWGTLHAGIDLAAPMLTPEYAAMDGIVLEAGPASGFGNAVYIQHENGDVTVYGHMEQILVTAGQVVKAGETIALLGNRGQSTGPHLHFEVHVGGIDGTKIDPIPWLRERGVNI
jgi:murein DD-endopeptidase MepM/ murein hydrolase activator NlpD